MGENKKRCCGMEAGNLPCCGQGGVAAGFSQAARRLVSPGSPPPPQAPTLGFSWWDAEAGQCCSSLGSTNPRGVCGPDTWPGGMGLRDPTVGPRQQVLGAALTPRRFPLSIFLIFATTRLENLGAGSFVAAEVLLASTRSPSFPVFMDLPLKPPCAGTLESRRASGHGPGPVCRWLCGVGQVPPADLWVCLGQELGAVMDGL